MFKLIGLLGITLCCGLAGMMKTAELKRRSVLLEDYLRMVIELKGQINYFREPLPDIFDKLKKNGDSKAFRLLWGISGEIGDKGSEIVNLWPLQVEEVYRGEPLTDEDLEIFKYIGEFVGQTDFENHIYHFSYLEDKLKKQIKDARENFRRKGPMYSKIGFFLGAIGAVILF